MGVVLRKSCLARRVAGCGWGALAAQKVLLFVFVGLKGCPFLQATGVSISMQSLCEGSTNCKVLL